MKKMEGKSARPAKDFWFTHGLQALSPEKFLKVVGKILNGEYVLLRFPYVGTSDSQSENRNGSPEILSSNGRMK